MTSSTTAPLAGKAALVTGASKGIGAVVAEALARAGADVVVNFASDREGADAVVRRIEAHGRRAIAAGADVAREGDVDGLYEKARAAFGTLDVLVNNAGVYRAASLEDSTARLFHELFDVNVLGLLSSTKRFAAQAGESASIVNVSAISSRIAPPNLGVYSATKSAVDVLTRTHAKELGPRGIRVNAISPGFIVTDGTRASGLLGSDMAQSRISQTPLRRAGEPDEIASTAVFLASEGAAFITGEIISVSGGN